MTWSYLNSYFILHFPKKYQTKHKLRNQTQKSSFLIFSDRKAYVHLLETDWVHQSKGAESEFNHTW